MAKPKRKQGASRDPESLSYEEEAFAQAVAGKGYNAAMAYRTFVSPGVTMASAWVIGCEWMQKLKIKLRINVLRKTFDEIMAEEFGHTKAAHAKYLLDVMHKPVGECTEMDPHVQAVRRRHGKTGRGTPGDGEEGGDDYEIEEIKMPNKLEAADQLAKMGSFYPKDKAEGEALSASAEAVAALRRLLEGEQEKPAG